MSRAEAGRRPNTPAVRPPAIERLPTLIVHGAAHGSAPQAASDDVMDRSGASYATPRRYEEEDDEE